MDKKFLSAEEAISQFGLDPATLQNLVDAGELRALADRGSWKYRRDELEQLIQSGQLPAQHPAGDGGSSTSTTPDFAFLEIDEKALEEGATTIKSGDDENSNPEIVGPESGFASDGEILMIESDPEVEVTQPGSSSSSEIPIASSLSDLDFVLTDGPKSEGKVVTDESSIIIGEGSDSSLISDSDVKVASDSDVKVVKDSATSGDVAVTDADHGVLGDSSVISPTEASSIISSDSDVRLTDSGISLEHGVPDSGITLESDSGISLQPDSGITVDSASDSGLTLEAAADSGLTLEAAADSGISLEASGDSGITLEGSGSGIMLEGSDSGLSLTDAESGIRLSGAPPVARAAKPDDTLPEFDQFGDSSDHTAMVETFEEGSSADLPTVPPPKDKPGKASKRAGLSDSFTMDDEVQDLEIVEDLEAGEVDVDSVAEFEEEDVLEASDDAFSMAESGEVSDESSAASVPVMKTVAKEPPWGVAAVIPLAACATLLLVQALLLFDGVSTMWDGNMSKAIGGAVIESLSGLGG